MMAQTCHTQWILEAGTSLNSALVLHDRDSIALLKFSVLYQSIQWKSWEKPALFTKARGLYQNWEDDLCWWNNLIHSYYGKVGKSLGERIF